MNHNHLPIRRHHLVILIMLMVCSLSATTRTVTNTSDNVMTTGSLRQVIVAAINGDTIVFDVSINGAPIMLSSQIAANKNLVIIGNGPQHTIIDGMNGSSRLFDLFGAWEFRDITFMNGGSTALLGGAIKSNTSVKVFNCKFESNTGLDGGAIYANGIVEIHNSEFHNNTGSVNGGAVYLNATTSLITSCQFSDNTASSGGAIYNDLTQTSLSEILDCSFDRETASNLGGAIYNLGGIIDNNILIYNCRFRFGQAFSGGAIYNEGSSVGQKCSPSLSNCTFFKNNAQVAGGAIYNHGASNGVSSPSLSNCTFYKNKAPEMVGGAMFNRGNSGVSISISNCIFWDNNDEIKNDGAQCSISNSILQDLIENDLQDMIPGANFIGGVILDDNPMFVDTASGNLRLSLGSPAIDQGNVASIFAGVITDQDGHPRVLYNSVDIGAYEGIKCPVGITTDTIYVARTDTVRTMIDGSSWERAFPDLQVALDISNTCIGDYEVWVADGTYMPTVPYDNDSDTIREIREKTFYINKDLKLYGGFEGHEDDITAREIGGVESILSGNIGSLESNLDNSYHVMHIDGSNSHSITSSCIIEGFSITEGLSLNIEGDNSFGAGIIVNGSNNGQCNPSISRSRFYDNHAFIGGALGNFGRNGQSSPSLVNCIFYNNIAVIGGAISNFAEDGECSPTLTNCTFTQNDALNGGAMANIGDSPTMSKPSLTNCILWNNGDEIYNASVSSSTSTTTITTLRHSIIQDDAIGGGLQSIAGVTYDMVIDSDPLFVDTLSGDLRLRGGSPAVNAGDNSIVTANDITTDLDRRTRIRNSTVDIGAHEGILCPMSTSTETIFVDSSSTSTLSDGSTWPLAFANLQEALDISNTCADDEFEIWVAAGTYSPTVIYDTNQDGMKEVREKTFYINRNVRLLGGFMGNESAIEERNLGSNTSILSGDIGQMNQPSDNSYHIMYIDGETLPQISGNCVIDGFSIAGGFAGTGNIGQEENLNDIGAAILNNGANNGLCSPLIINCRFYKNVALAAGGAIANIGEGGESSPVVFNCSFLQNASLFGGGAVYNFGKNGISSPLLINNSFTQNATLFTSIGGAMYSVGTGGTSEPNILNSIFWDNGVAITNESAATTIGYSIIQDNQIDGAIEGIAGVTFLDGVIDSDPMFVDTAVGDLHLMDSSPAINTGLTSQIILEIYGSSGIQHGRIDIGAYEFDGCPDVPLRFSPPFDLNFTTEAYTKQTITTDGKIDDGVQITFDAKRGVLLNKKFEVEAGSILIANTEGCN